MDLLPNRLAAVEFEPVELETILGLREEEKPSNTDNFNWVAAYLCEEVGITELDLCKWFRREVPGLDDQSPLDIWTSEDGFGRVFSYAQKCKEYADSVASDTRSDAEEVPRSHQIASRALVVVDRALEMAGAVRSFDENGRIQTGVHNPARPEELLVTLRGDESSEVCKIIKQDGDRLSQYLIYRHVLDGADLVILQTAIFTNDKSASGSLVDIDSRSDLDDRPPSAGEIASFVVPLAVEVKNGSLVPVEFGYHE